MLEASLTCILAPMHLAAHGNAYLKTEADLAENRKLLQTEPAESELAAMARKEIARLESRRSASLKICNLAFCRQAGQPRANTIVEIRAGAGGSESLYLPRTFIACTR